MIWVYAVEKLLLALIAGGGIVLAACVRPFITQALMEGGGNQLVSGTIENISISYWNRYNRLALLSVSLFVIIESIRFAAGFGQSVISLVFAVIILFMLVRKLFVDNALRTRLQADASVVGSDIQNNGHREVELLSKLIILVALVLLLWHQ